MLQQESERNIAPGDYTAQEWFICTHYLQVLDWIECMVAVNWLLHFVRWPATLFMKSKMNLNIKQNITLDWHLHKIIHGGRLFFSEINKIIHAAEILPCTEPHDLIKHVHSKFNWSSRWHLMAFRWFQQDTAAGFRLNHKCSLNCSLWRNNNGS